MRYIMTTQGTYLAVFRSVKQLNIQHSWLTFYYFSAKNSRIFSLHALGTNISSNLNNAHLQQLVFIKEYYGLQSPIISAFSFNRSLPICIAHVSVLHTYKGPTHHHHTHHQRIQITIITNPPPILPLVCGRIYSLFTAQLFVPCLWGFLPSLHFYNVVHYFQFNQFGGDLDGEV